MLQTDYELSYSDVQTLSSTDALAAFFARLGYNTNGRPVQNVVAMNITSDPLRAAITHIERLANHEGRMFEVYLFELKSVLGFIFQPVKPASGSAVSPDNSLFAPTTNTAISVKPLALCLASTWRRNLDGRDDQRDTLAPDENPGAAVVTLLGSGEADWAIVTNGKTWRLYAAKAHSRATNYYEIDLEEILVLPDTDRQRAFFIFLAPLPHRLFQAL